MPTLERPFEEIAIDFVVELPESEDFNAVLVVTEWFRQVEHYILAEKTWTAAEVVNSYLNDIWK